MPQNCKHNLGLFRGGKKSNELHPSLHAEELRVLQAADEGGDRGERAQRHDGVGGGVALQQAGLGQAEQPAHRVRVARALLVHRELGQRRDVQVRAELPELGLHEVVEDARPRVLELWWHRGKGEAVRKREQETGKFTT